MTRTFSIGQRKRSTALCRRSPKASSSCARSPPISRSLSDQYCYFDLGELRGYEYHTGVVFAAYVPGYGEAISNGGRYDDIGEVFGRARATTGFDADLKILLAQGNRPAPETAASMRRPTPILHWQTPSPPCATTARILRAFPGQLESASDMDCNFELVRAGKAWQIKPI